MQHEESYFKGLLNISVPSDLKENKKALKLYTDFMQSLESSLYKHKELHVFKVIFQSDRPTGIIAEEYIEDVISPSKGLTVIDSVFTYSRKTNRRQYITVMLFFIHGNTLSKIYTTLYNAALPLREKRVSASTSLEAPVSLDQTWSVSYVEKVIQDKVKWMGSRVKLRERGAYRVKFYHTGNTAIVPCDFEEEKQKTSPVSKVLNFIKDSLKSIQTFILRIN